MNIETPQLTPAPNWVQTRTEIFWGEIAPCDHVVQIYDTDEVFIDSLAGFVGSGINAGECVIVIATGAHIQSLEERLKSFGISVDILKNDDRYIPMDAEATLKKFMVNGWPDETLFHQAVAEIMDRASRKPRKVRAFGEMVALLWEQGLKSATVNLECLWTKFCENKELSLFCAYPKSGFTQDINESINDICSCHSKMIHGSESSMTQLSYAHA